MLSLNKRYALFFLAITLTAIARSSLGDSALRCAICGMTFKLGAKTSFESTRSEAPIHFCSFSCVRRFHKKYPTARLFAWDFTNGKKIDAITAYFLIKSRHLLEELEFDMPPSVIAFEEESSAKKTQARLKDGALVHGYPALEKTYE